MVLLFLFLLGVRSIQEDLHAQLLRGEAPVKRIEFRNDQLPPLIELVVGEEVEFVHRGALAMTLQSVERDQYGQILFQTPPIPPGGTFRFHVPEYLAGLTLNLQNIHFPMGVSILQTQAAPRASGGTSRSSPVPRETGSPPGSPRGPESYELTRPPPLPELPITPVTPDIPRQGTPALALPEVELPTMPANVVQVPAVELPQPLEVAEETPTVSLGERTSLSTPTSWPRALRVNRFTVGSLPLRLSPLEQLPLHAVARTQQQVATAARRQGLIPVQPPATGPALGIVGLLSIAAVLVLQRKSRRH
jgi:hypothetical protein